MKKKPLPSYVSYHGVQVITISTDTQAGVSMLSVMAHNNGLFFEVDVTDGQGLVEEFEGAAGA